MANAACAVLTVQDADASKLSPLLQSAWMEGCIKRGLDGHIEPVASDAVEIVARGPLPRLRSFARWCAAQLPASSELTSDVDLDSCPMPPAKPARPLGWSLASPSRSGAPRWPARTPAPTSCRATSERACVCTNKFCLEPTCQTASAASAGSRRSPS